MSRRELIALLPALAVGEQTPAPAILPAKTYHSNQIPYSGNATKKSRNFFHGATHSGFDLQMHETILGPGLQSHPPHKHVYEEIVIVMEGSVESTIDGKTETAEAGSVIYFGSNLMHSSRNAGSIPCRYYVMELLGDA